MIRVGLVGCGGRGNGHAVKLRALEKVQLVGVCDIIKERADALAAKVGVPALYDFHEFLSGVDVIWDCTRGFERAPVVIDSADAGKHVFSEKPMAIDLDAADRIVAAVERNGVKHSYCYSLHFTNPYKAVKAAFASGELGELVSVWTRRYMPIDMRSRWYGDQSVSGGVILDFQSHDLDLICWFGGMPKTVFACADRIRADVKADEHALVTMAFEHGMGSSEVSWWSPASMSEFGVVGTKGSIIADGSGAVRKRLDGQDEEVLDVNAAANVDLSGNIGEGTAADAVKDLACLNETPEQHFIRCVEDDLEPIVTPTMARNVLRVVLAALESAETGRAVDPASLHKTAP